MTGDIDMNNNTLANLKDPVAASSGATKRYVDATHVDASGTGPQENSFKYLMEDVDESSAKNNITVHNISSFSASPHQINENAYNFTLINDKDGTEQYRSRIGFNLFRLPIGFYTLVEEFFPPEMRNVSVHATADSLSFGTQTSKTFQATATIAAYVKTILHFQKRQVGQREYIYLDLHGKTAFPNPSGCMVVCGVNGTVAKVPSTVFEQIFFVKNGKMQMQTDLDLDGKTILKAKLGGPLDLDGQQVKDGSASLFDGTNGELTMLNHINMNSFLIKEAKLGGNLSLNSHDIYSRETLLFQNNTNEIKVPRPFIIGDLVYDIKSLTINPQNNFFTQLFVPNISLFLSKDRNHFKRSIKRKDIFNFNHISPNLEKSELSQLKNYIKLIIKNTFVINGNIRN